MIEVPDELRALSQRVVDRFEVADPEHRQHRDRWDGFMGQYHSYTDFKRSYASSAPRDRDKIMSDGIREFGADLYIPHTFTVIETILPRMLSNRPRMLFLPRDRDSARNTENMRWMLDAQQERLAYELTLQTTGKTGLILGLGVQKCWWDYYVRDRYVIARRRLLPGWRRATVRSVDRDDPCVEDVDPYDFLWEPTADRIANAGWVIHRTWRSTEYVLDRFRTGEWDLLPDAREITAEDLRENRLGEWESVWKVRRQAQGYTGSSVAREGAELHEVWEFHTRDEVITVLDRQTPVRYVGNPAWHGELPFHVYRPTEIPHCMVGKGEPEPIESLQDEINTVRSMRLDHAILRMQAPIFYEDGVLDPHTIRWGPGYMNAVQTGGQNIRDMLMPMQVGDLPISSYREIEELRSDIERASGISDQTAGATLASETATGAQLVQASANVRIQLKTRRMERELIAGVSRQMVLLNQQRIVSNRDVRIPTVPQPGSGLDQAWAWRSVGPSELAGMWEIVPEGGSTAPDNVPQDRSDAQALMPLIGNPMLNARALLPVVLEKLGLRHVEAYLAPDTHVPSQTLDAIMQMLVVQGKWAPDQARQFIQAALDQGRQMEAQQAQGDGGGQAPAEPQPAAQAA